MAKASKATRGAKAEKAAKVSRGETRTAARLAGHGAILNALDRIEAKLTARLAAEQQVVVAGVLATLGDLEGVAVQGMSDEQRGHWLKVRDALGEMLGEQR